MYSRTEPSPSRTPPALPGSCPLSPGSGEGHWRGHTLLACDCGMTLRWRNPVPCRVLPVGSPMISAGTSLLGCHPGCMSLTPPNSPGPAQSLRRSGRGLPTAWLVHGRVLQTAPGSCSLSWQSWGPTGAGRSMASLSHPSFPASTSAPKAPPDSGGVQEGAGSAPKGTTELPRTLGPFLNWLFFSSIFFLSSFQGPGHLVDNLPARPAGESLCLHLPGCSCSHRTAATPVQLLASFAPHLCHQQQLSTRALDHRRGIRGSQAGVLFLAPSGMCRENKAAVMGEIPWPVPAQGSGDIAPPVPGLQLGHCTVHHTRQPTWLCAARHCALTMAPWRRRGRARVKLRRRVSCSWVMAIFMELVTRLLSHSCGQSPWVPGLAVERGCAVMTSWLKQVSPDPARLSWALPPAWGVGEGHEWPFCFRTAR